MKHTPSYLRPTQSSLHRVAGSKGTKDFVSSRKSRIRKNPVQQQERAPRELSIDLSLEDLPESDGLPNSLSIPSIDSDIEILEQELAIIQEEEQKLRQKNRKESFRSIDTSNTTTIRESKINSEQKHEDQIDFEATFREKLRENQRKQRELALSDGFSTLSTSTCSSSSNMRGHLSPVLSALSFSGASRDLSRTMFSISTTESKDEHPRGLIEGQRFIDDEDEESDIEENKKFVEEQLRRLRVKAISKYDSPVFCDPRGRATTWTPPSNLDAETSHSRRERSTTWSIPSPTLQEVDSVSIRSILSESSTSNSNKSKSVNTQQQSSEQIHKENCHSQSNQSSERKPSFSATFRLRTRRRFVVPPNQNY